MQVTIIVPTHNSQKYINECIDSIINQTLSDIEILCIDSSSDETANIINSYAQTDSRVNYIYDSNTSYGFKINEGIKRAKGKYITIVESDDYIALDMLYILYDIAENNEIDFVKAGHIEFFDTNNRRIYETIDSLPDKLLYNRVIDLKKELNVKKYIGFNIWSGIYKKEFLISNRLFLNTTPGASYQDTGFRILTSLAAKRVYFINDYLYKYRRDNNDSSVKSNEKYRCIIEEYKWIKNEMHQKGLIGSDEEELFKHKKLMSYFWNYDRLLIEYKYKFLNEIKEEMEEEYPIDLCLDNFTRQQIMQIKILHGDETEINNWNQIKTARYAKFLKIVNLLLDKKDVIIFGAGRYGESLLQLSSILGLDNIVGICDNDELKQEKILKGKKIESPYKIISNYHNAFFIITNKNNSEVMYRQLIDFKITKDNIFIVNEFPVKNQLMEAALKLLGEKTI